MLALTQGVKFSDGISWNPPLFASQVAFVLHRMLTMRGSTPAHLLEVLVPMEFIAKGLEIVPPFRMNERHLAGRTSDSDAVANFD